MKQNYATEALGPDWKKAFKDADIRGIYGQEINEASAYRTALAFVTEFKIPTLVVGYDMRISSPGLKSAFIAGAREAGANVIDLGLVTTPMVYYFSGKNNYHGVMITASHNPAEYNGLKLVFPEAIPLTNKSGLAIIKKIVGQELRSELKSVKAGQLRRKNIQKEYELYIKKKIPRPAKRLKIVVDAGNGMGALLLPLLGEYAEITPLFPELDGNFPNRPSNPTLKNSQKKITSVLKAGDFDFGVAFDGDSDRVAFFDESGRYINAAHIGALLAQKLLLEYPKTNYVYTSFTSRIYLETIKAGGGKGILAKVGHAFIKEEMRAHDAYFGCEHSAHFYFKDNFYADSVILPVLYILAEVTKAKTNQITFSQLVKPFAKYFQTEEVLVEVGDKDKTLANFSQWISQEPNTRVKVKDGVNVTSPTWWAVIKKSVTEDALKFIIEANDKKTALAKQTLIKDWLSQR